MPEPDCFLRYSYKRCYAEFYVAAARRGFKMVYSLTGRNTFVGGTCAPPSALLVLHVTMAIHIAVL